MRRRLPAAALAAAVCLLAAACQSSTPAAVQLNPTSVAGQSAQTVAKYLAITPAPGTKDANPADGITVSARNGGKLGNVSVHTSGDAVTGSLSGGGEQLAQHVDAGHRPVLHGDRHRYRCAGSPGHLH